MEKLKEYLYEAKKNGWCLDPYGLSIQYNIQYEIVKVTIEEIYNF